MSIPAVDGFFYQMNETSGSTISDAWGRASDVTIPGTVTNLNDTAGYKTMAGDNGVFLEDDYVRQFGNYSDYQQILIVTAFYTSAYPTSASEAFISWGRAYNAERGSHIEYATNGRTGHTYRDSESGQVATGDISPLNEFFLKIHSVFPQKYDATGNVMLLVDHWNTVDMGLSQTDERYIAEDPMSGLTTDPVMFARSNTESTIGNHLGTSGSIMVAYIMVLGLTVADSILPYKMLHQMAPLGPAGGTPNCLLRL